MNSRQEAVLRILQMTDKQRDLYKTVRNNYQITYSADFNYVPLTESDMRGLKDGGLIVEKWPDCYVLNESKS